MSTGEDAKKNEEIRRSDEAKCFCCGHKVKSDAEGVRSGKTVMCDACYEAYINPFPKLCWAVS